MNQRILDLIFFWTKTARNTNGDKLYLQAISSLGNDISPRDEAPDEYGCVDSLQEIYKLTFKEYIGAPKTLSTKILYQTLLFSPKYEKIEVPERGCIIISPTGHSTKGAPTGHTGIVGDCGIILSNDSRSGLWLENYTVRGWELYFGQRLGFPVKYFRVK